MSLVTATVLCALAGVVFGVFGAGGSTLLVPVFVYVLGMPVHEALAVALAILTAMGTVTALAHARAGHIEVGTGIAWAALGGVGAWLGGHLAGGIPDAVLLVLFAAAVIAAAARMMRVRGLDARREAEGGTRRRLSRPASLAAGFGVGIFTGTLGMGGGFLLVPALVILAGVEMRRAIGTSAMIIAVNAAGGLAGLAGHTSPHWRGVPVLALVTVLGNLVGARLSRRVPVRRLRPAFAAFLIVVGVAILARELAGLSAALH